MDKDAKIKKIIDMLNKLPDAEQMMAYSFIMGLVVGSTGKHVKDLLDEKDKEFLNEATDK